MPERRWTGLLDVVDYTAEMLGLERTAWLSEHTTTSLGTTVALRMASLWVDGERSLLEIGRRVALSTGLPADLAVLERYFRDLAEAGAVVLREQHLSAGAEGCP